MFQLSRLLYPTDFSPSADAALPLALDLARRHGAELHLLHVSATFGEDPLPGIYASLIDERAFAERVHRAAKEQAEAVLARHDTHDVPLHVAFRRGKPGAEILAYAEEVDADLLVLGTHGRRGPRRVLLGSVAEAVARHARSPVLIVREAAEAEENASPEVGVNHLLVPLDFSACDLSALRHAKEMAALYGASVDLLHVIDPMQNMEVYTAGVAHQERVERHEEDLALQRMKQWYDGASGPFGPVERLARTGYPPQEIIEVAKERQADLIVIASHGQTALEQFPLGSVTERVIRMAPCSVLVIKSFGKSLAPPARRAVHRRRTAPPIPVS